MSRDCLVVMFTITCILNVCVKSVMVVWTRSMPNIASRVIEISFLTLGDRFFGEAIFNMYSNDLKLTFPFYISLCMYIETFV